MNDKSSNIKGLWCYALGWLSGIFFLTTSWDNKFVRFHAIQSIIFFGLITLAEIFTMNIPGISGLIFIFFIMISMISWKWLMWTAFKGEMFHLPLIGYLAGQLSNANPVENAQIAVRFQK
jgi:uncharacterized membrane protein